MVTCLSTQPQKKDSELGTASRLFSLAQEENPPSPFQEMMMCGRRSVWTVTLDFQTRTTLRDFLQRRKTPVGVARRAHAMLLLEQGHSYIQTAKWVGLAAYHVRKWIKRFQEHGVAGLLEKPRPGRSQCLRQK